MKRRDDSWLVKAQRAVSEAEMSDLSGSVKNFPPEQEAIRDKCFHPTGTFVEFKKEEIEQSIPERFETVVRRYPNQRAVKMGDVALTYDELNRAANVMARAIVKESGPGKEPIVLLFEHGIDVITAIIGVLKAGKCYVVLDPSFPKERNSYILEDSQARLIVTNERNANLSRVLAHDSSVRLNIDEIVDSVSSDNLDLCISPDDPAVIVYTSGSTGVSKGVVQSHRIPLYYGLTYAGRLRTTCDDRFTLLHSFSFASAEVHLYRSLLTGGTLFPFDLKSEGIQRLAHWLEEEQITICHLPPAAFRQLAEVLPARHKLSHLRLVHLSGAPITQWDFELYKTRFPAETLFVFHMGSTEAAGICSAVTDHSFSFPSEGTPIGYPYPGKKIFLLDESGREVGPGEVGEIAVKSRYLAASYWRSPDLTKAKFFPDPDGDDERIYRTGDLGRMLPDGFLIHLGRKDFMVKIRGYRVEPGEIERALLSHPQTKEVGVVAWDREPGEKYLAAYVVPRDNPPPTINQLYDFLKTKLPHYMIPSTFVFLESIPLTNGKIDRQGLPKPDNNRPELAEAFVAPQTQAEQVLAKIWAEVLNLDPIGIHDNFFELGGDSIRSIQILARANQAGFRLTPKDIFEHQTIAELATFVGTLGTEVKTEAVTGIVHRRSPQAGCYTPADFPLTRLDQRQLERILQKLKRTNGPQEIEDIYPLSPVQWGMLFYSLWYPADRRVYHHQFCYSLRGDLDVALFERSWRYMVERHSILRTAFLTDPFQIVKRHANLPLDYRDWRGLSSVEQEERLEEFLEADRRRRFEISEPPLIRLALFRLSETHYQFVRTFHHVILDGWSTSILWKEVLACYEALSRGQEPDWQPAPPFRDYIAWLQQQEQKNSEAEAFWRTLLKDFAMPTPLGEVAVSRTPREKRDAHDKVEVQLSRAEATRLQAFALEHRLTMNTLAQAAWAVLLSRYSGKLDVVLGTVTAVRPPAITGIESMVGPLINVLPVRVRLAPRDSALTVLKKLHRQQAEMSQYNYSSMIKVQEWSGLPLSTSLFGSLFLFQNSPQAPYRGRDGSFEISPDRSSGRTNYTLALVVRPASELSLGIGFDANRFDKATITRMLGDFKMFLRAIISDPDQRVVDLMKASVSAAF